MRKILKIIVLSLFFCGSAYAEFIELKKCFKSAGYGFGNDKYDTIGKSWDSWLPRYIYTGDFDKCRDFDMNIVFSEKLSYSECYLKKNLNHLTSSEDVIIDGVTWTSDVNPSIDPKDWKKLNWYSDNIFSISTSDGTITNLKITNQEVINFRIKWEKFYANRIANYYLSIKEYEKANEYQNGITQSIGVISEQYESEDYTINSFAGGIIRASKPGGDRYYGIGLFKQIIEKNELFIDLNSSKIEIKKEVFNTGHKHTQSQLPKRYTVRTVYSCDKKLNDDGEKESGASSGTAFFINKKGYLLTNNHVVEGCTLSKISYKNKEYEAKLIATDKTLDLALLKAEVKPKTFLNFSNDEAKKLNKVYVAGYPLGKGLSDDLKISSGIVSSIKGFEDNSNEIQIDAPINPGNSGGPIINENGDLVAIAVAGMTEAQNINFGIKSSAAERFLKSNNINPSKSMYSRVKDNDKLLEILEEGTVYTYCD
jgi:S1-C subfamily serine protease